LTEKTAWRTIRQANQQAKPGDTILVSPGRYFHSIIPQLSGQPGKRITYKRNGNGEVLIDGRGYYTPLALLLKKNHITIDGFIFTGMPLENNGTIIITNSNEVKILNCRVGHKKEKDTFFSINGTTCRNLLIEGNVFHGAASQLHVVNTPGLIVRNNTFAMPQPKIGAGGVNCVQVFNQPETVRITNNIFYGVGPRPSPQVAVYPGKDKGAVIFDYNLFFAGGKKKIIQVYGADCVTPVIPGATFEEWQTKSGQDANSIHADPLFVDVEAGDLRLKPNSPAIGAGENGTTIGGSEVAK
jgi:hypothetical protein